MTVLQDLPGFVAATGADTGVAAHYGDPLAEQRSMARAAAFVDHSHRGVLAVTGPDRLSWLHSLTSQHLTGLRDGEVTEALVLSPHGHVEHHAVVTDLDGTTWLDVEPGTAAALAAYLDSMRFMLRVEVSDRSADVALVRVAGPQAAAALSVDLPPHRAVATDDGFVRRPGERPAYDVLVPRDRLHALADDLVGRGVRPAGTLADAALRVEAMEPRAGVDTDHRTIPHEVGYVGPAVHLDKGCYRGQETVARVHNLGRPPRRLVLLHVDGSLHTLPEPGDEVTAGGRRVGVVGTAALHHEDGPIALALVKRGVADGEDVVLTGEDRTLAARVDHGVDIPSRA